MIGGLPGLLENHAARAVRRDHDIPSSLRRRGMRKDVRIDPLDCVAHTRLDPLR